MDIGGGTVNAAVVRSGVLIDTACLGIGGRCLRISEGGALLSHAESAMQLFGPEAISSILTCGASSELLREWAGKVVETILAFLEFSGHKFQQLLLTPPLKHNYQID